MGNIDQKNIDTTTHAKTDTKIQLDSKSTEVNINEAMRKKVKSQSETWVPNTKSQNYYCKFK